MSSGNDSPSGNADAAVVKFNVVSGDKDEMRRWDDERAAEVRLIIAAPGMLAALKEVVAAHKDGTWISDEKWLVETARTAIAKATPSP